MPISITTRRPIDLHRIEVNDKAKELVVLTELQGQIRKWLTEHAIPMNKVYTILINKLVYYSVREINQNINPQLKISSGWYKYGPCFEAMREREMDQYTFGLMSPTKNYVDEVAKICETEVPIYMKTLNEDIKNSGRYFYDYLKHIYTDKDRMIYSELSGFYPAKHDLEYFALKAAYAPNSINKGDITKHIIRFNSEIANTRYSNFVGLDENLIERVFDFTIALEQILISNKELKEKEKSDELIEAYAKTMSHEFDHTTLMIFAYKNYLATYRDVNQDEEAAKKSAFSDQVNSYFSKNSYLTGTLLELISKKQFSILG